MSDKTSLYVGHKGCWENKYRSSRRQSGRRPLNRHVLETVSEECFSAFSKKLNLNKNMDDFEISVSLSYRFINLLSVLILLSQLLVCKQCYSDVRFEEKSRRGLGFKIAIICDNFELREINSCPLIKTHAYDINYRIVLVMCILLGIGLNSIKNFCAFMELPHLIFQSCYDKFVKAIDTAVSNVCVHSITNPVVEEKRLSEQKGINNGISVSGDGSWRKRGFSSLFGVTTRIGSFSGKIVDIIVKSKYCMSCEFWSLKGTAEYEEWKTDLENQCSSKHAGSAGKMVVRLIIEMFSRSEALHNVKYCTYIGDGDSKIYKGIVDAQGYPDFTVKKKSALTMYKIV